MRQASAAASAGTIPHSQSNGLWRPWSSLRATPATRCSTPPAACDAPEARARQRLMQRKRVLVSGAGGFIGRWSIPALLRSGYEVHAVLGANGNRAVPAQVHGAELHRADLLDHSAIDELMGEVKPTHLLHFAWIATPGLYWNSADNFRWLAASEHLLRCFRAEGGSRVMMAGSCAEYDWSRVEVCDELSSPLAKDASADHAA